MRTVVMHNFESLPDIWFFFFHISSLNRCTDSASVPPSSSRRKSINDAVDRSCLLTRGFASFHHLIKPDPATAAILKGLGVLLTAMMAFKSVNRVQRRAVQPERRLRWGG